METSFVILGIAFLAIFIVWGASSKKDYFPAKVDKINSKGKSETHYVVQSTRKSNILTKIMGYKTYQGYCVYSSFDLTFVCYEEACNYIKFLKSEEIVTPMVCKI